MIHTLLGIDIGSVAVSIVLLDENKKIIKTSYCFHKGAIREKVFKILNNMDFSSLGGIAVTTSTPDILTNKFCYDTQISIIKAIKHFHNNVGSILYVGGENFSLIKFSEKGEYESLRSNSSCAAGTGSFLDQQAKRLNMKNSKELSETADLNVDNAPQIATRCAVFAKTDLIHTQQQGYSLSQISDGLCQGLVKNIVDTLIPDESKIRTPLIFAGGVSMNHSVIKHLQNLLEIKPEVGKYSQLYGAFGAALLHLEEVKSGKIEFSNITPIIKKRNENKTYEYKPLNLHLSQYPEFICEQKYNYISDIHNREVEVEIYKNLTKIPDVYMGIDIGSTSTKAVLIDEKNNVFAGFYTKTSGQPIDAAQAIFEAITDVARHNNIDFKFSGVSTTGSGRKFVGKVINADLIIDEITAHARAAYELDNDVDTIFEIGGQDAKFTTMKNGIVTFSLMNNVCAAGTGSFIEEQAQKLKCPLSEYSERAINTAAPHASDRCTVFMERDINHYLIKGYSVNEVLASVLHSVRDNYLTKVAVQANIGKKICFQGATARNKALIAAFEQKLQKSIFVSKFCHLTGALGSAIIMTENKIAKSKFRGIELYKEKITVVPEVCGLCNNNCKISKVAVQDTIVAFGFLCGRDYETKRYVNTKKNIFELIKERKIVFKLNNKPEKYKLNKTIGIPQALYLSEVGIIWKHFFNTLGIKTISSEKIKEPIKTGKRITDAEFCSPISAIYGHVKYLCKKADYIFLPIYFEARKNEKERINQYCYYSQFAPSLLASIDSFKLKDKVIMPIISPKSFIATTELSKILKPILLCSYWSIFFAYQRALYFYNDRKKELINIFNREFQQTNEISILFLGRPYTILENNMNKHIPEIFANLEIKTFYMDMIENSRVDETEIEELLNTFNWHYASKILKSAVFSAKKDGLYPVYITSFKCGPDSFAIEYFKRIMHKYQKPYLILQIDEHDSSTGYETRIEAAIHSFRNHYKKLKKNLMQESILPVIPKVVTKINSKTLLFPSWDPINTKLLEAVLIKEGIDARNVPLTESAIQLGPKTNTGMCIPVNIIIQSYIDYIESHCLDPGQTLVWMFDSNLACNIKLYPYFIKSIFEAYGKGMDKVEVYLGKITFEDISFHAAIDGYFANMFGGMLRKMGCKIRPYEKIKGITDKIIEQSVSILYNSFLGNRNKEDDIIKVVNLYKKIDTVKKERLKVAVFGDLYVRDNDVFNQNLIHCIEDYGAEAITMPFSDIIKMAANPLIERSIKFGTYINAIAAKAMITIANSLEKNYYKHFNSLLSESEIDGDIDYKKVLDNYNLKIDHSGESADNLINIFSLKRRYPDIKLFVQTNPAFCCAGIVTQAMSSQIEKNINTPLVTLNYDGTNKAQNEKLIPYIKLIHQR